MLFIELLEIIQIKFKELKIITDKFFLNNFYKINLNLYYLNI